MWVYFHYSEKRTIFVRWLIKKWNWQITPTVYKWILFVVCLAPQSSPAREIPAEWRILQWLSVTGIFRNCIWLMPIHIKTDLLHKRFKLYITPLKSRAFPHYINPCQTAGPVKGYRYQKKRAKEHATVTFVLTSEMFFRKGSFYILFLSSWHLVIFEKALPS